MSSFEELIRVVERRCREETVFMLGPEKARFLVQLLEKYRPGLVVECGTGIGYSGLWIAHTLERLETVPGRLITFEVSTARAHIAQRYFQEAGLAHRVEVRKGDAAKLLGELQEPFAFLLLDNHYQNYYPCFRAAEEHLRNGAIILADNVGIGAYGMRDYLDLVRTRFQSHTHRFKTNLPWMDRDAMEVTVYRKGN